MIKITKIRIFLLSVLLLPFFIIAIYPESPSTLLTSSNDWNVRGQSISKLPISAFPEQYRQVRQTAIDSFGGVLFRTWTPDKGIIPLEVSSTLFRPARYMLVAITGTNRTREGKAHIFIECEANKQRLEVFRGSVNVNVAEAIVVSPHDWCPGNARLKFVSTEKNQNVGAGAVFEISFLSYLKTTFFGRLPYFVTSLVIFALVMVGGASILTHFGWIHDPFPAALVSLGVASLSAFYLASAVSAYWSWIGAAFIAIAVILALLMSGRASGNRTIQALIPYACVWSFTSLVYFAILGLAINGVGHWEPNYRFWPANWSSDNELPWIFAEAIRRGWDLRSLFGGGWIPTDRPPLMTGAYLLLADVFGWMQSGNDGDYIRGHAYNAAAVTLNALWAPACWWLLLNLRKGLDQSSRTVILVFVGCLPFVLFNTIYGWPKVFGAAFALLAFGIAWQARGCHQSVSQKSEIVLFFLLGAFSMLAHASTALFLAPLGLLFLWWVIQHNTRSVLAGFTIAFALLVSWSLYKAIILPSANPVTKFALTGDFGFTDPELSVWEMLVARYSNLDIWQWLEIKKTMLLQSFLPLHHSIVQVRMNTDFGTSVIDRLRAWDFMMLSKGNLAVPLFVIATVWGSLKAFSNGRLDVLDEDAPFLTIIGVSLIAWALMVVGFFAPVIIHHWPQAALFGMALAGAVVVHDRYPSIFLITLFAVITYTGLVWILSPLRSALDVDIGAASLLILLLSWLLLRGFLKSAYRCN